MSGLDGFSMVFWKFCWPIVSKEVMEIFKGFYLKESFKRSLNATCLFLIPKKGVV